LVLREPNAGPALSATAAPAMEASPVMTLSPTPDLAGLEPLKTIRSRWPMVIGALLTLAMVGGLARELFDSGLAGLGRSLPGSPWFYIAFALLYMSPPFFDYLIFRRLWGIPLAGLAALMKKRIANDVVIGYSGEAYFYAWARARASMVASPFGAVKDVSILSAIAGNAITLAMCAIALPLGRGLLTPDQFRTALGSAAITFAICLPFLLFSKRVFSMERGQLWNVFGLHCVRLLCGSVLIAIVWHLALPGVGLAMWLFLAAARLLVSRLPLVPNKDLLFANFAILLIGQDQALSELVALTAALTLLTHVVLIAGFGVEAAVARSRQKVAA
jgi:hypothetical protein